MGTKSRETIYSASIRATAQRATEARKEADRLAVEAWNKRMLGFQGPAQPSPALGDAINAGFGYLEVNCLGCNTHQTVALDIVRRPKATPVHELERCIRCKDCSQVCGYTNWSGHFPAGSPADWFASVHVSCNIQCHGCSGRTDVRLDSLPLGSAGVWSARSAVPLAR
jgi:hypothetical protein